MRISKATERWFVIPQDPDKARVLIKHLNPGDIQDIVDEVMVQEIEYMTGDDGKPKSVVRQKNNRRLDREKTMVAAVSNWEKFFDADGKALKCTEKNVIRATREIDGFAEFVGECRKTLADEIGTEFEAQKKT